METYIKINDWVTMFKIGSYETFSNIENIAPRLVW